MTKTRVLPDSRCPPPAGPYASSRRDDELAAAADLHAGDAVLPALDQAAQRELDRLAAVPRGVELLAGLEVDADVVHEDLAPGLASAPSPTTRSVIRARSAARPPGKSISGFSLNSHAAPSRDGSSGRRVVATMSTANTSVSVPEIARLGLTLGTVARPRAAPRAGHGRRPCWPTRPCVPALDHLADADPEPGRRAAVPRGVEGLAVGPLDARRTGR